MRGSQLNNDGEPRGHRRHENSQSLNFVQIRADKNVRMHHDSGFVLLVELRCTLNPQSWQNKHEAKG